MAAFTLITNADMPVFDCARMNVGSGFVNRMYFFLCIAETETYPALSFLNVGMSANVQSSQMFVCHRCLAGMNYVRNSRSGCTCRPPFWIVAETLLESFL